MTDNGSNCNSCFNQARAGLGHGLDIEQWINQEVLFYLFSLRLNVVPTQAVSVRGVYCDLKLLTDQSESNCFQIHDRSGVYINICIPVRTNTP